MTAAVASAHQPPADPTATSWPSGVLAVVPVYDNAGTVGEVVAGLRALGARVLCVDDGSRDGSGAVAIAAGAELVTHPENRGKAAALMTGLRGAHERGYRSMLSVDADGQHPIPMAAALATCAERSPDGLVVGEREMSAAPRASRIGRWWCNVGVRVAGGRWPGDSQSGLRVYPVVATLALGVPASRYAFEVEVLVRASWAGIPLHRESVSVLYPADRVSHFRAWRDSWHAARVILRLAACRLLRRTAVPRDQPVAV